MRSPELKDLRHTKVRNPVQSQIEGLDVGNVLIRRLGDQMPPKRTRQTRDAEFKVVLEDLIGSPSVLPRFGVVDVLSVAQDLALSAVQRPNENDFVLAPTAAGSRSSTRYCGGIGNTKLKDNPLLGKSKGLRSVFDAIVNLVRAENVRHICCSSSQFRKFCKFRKIQYGVLSRVRFSSLLMQNRYVVIRKVRL